MSKNTDLLPCMRIILRHFKLNRKSTHLLNEDLEIMDLKAVHIIKLCPNRMSYILSASTQIVNMLVPICDVLSSADIQREERDQFTSQKGLIITDLWPDLEAVFVKTF